MKVAFKRADGGVSIVDVKDMETAYAEFEKWESTAAIGNSNWLPATVQAIESIPSDREFRDAWEYADGAIVINLAKAAAIQAIRINEAKASRERELQAREAAGEDVTTERFQLHDITLVPVMSAKNLNELKTAWPKILERY